MVAKVRGVADQLRALGDPVRAEELDGRLKAARQDAGRALRDRVDLYEGGGQTIRLGRHRFAVNTQPVDLTLVPYEGTMAYAVTGTDYRLPVRDPAFDATRPYWDQLAGRPRRPRCTAPSTWPPTCSPGPRSTRCAGRRPRTAGCSPRCAGWPSPVTTRATSGASTTATPR